MGANTATAAIASFSGGRFMSGQYSESIQSKVLRTDMDAGLPKQAKRNTRQLFQRNMTYLFTDAEYAAFKAWHKNTAQYGAKWFVYVDPVSGDTIDARIVEGKYDAQPVNARMNNWFVTFILEVWG